MDRRPSESSDRGVVTYASGLIVGIFVGVLLWSVTGSLILGLLMGVPLGIAISIRNIRPVGSDNRWWPRL